MKIYALVGKSGTGKSYQSLNLCKEKDIEAIIDDGLLISENKICAGKSAKRQANMVGAIKTALFTEDSHMEGVSKCIKERKFRSLLVIGTSDRMVNKIVKRLDIGEIDEIVRVEDITNQKERELARKQRMDFGKHIIPVSALHLKKDFSGYFLDSLKLFRRLTGGKHVLTEKSVVRPTFSYLGEFTISSRAMNDILAYITENSEGISETIRTDIKNEDDGVVINLEIYGKRDIELIPACEKLQKSIIEKVEMMTAFNVISVNIAIKGLS